MDVQQIPAQGTAEVLSGKPASYWIDTTLGTSFPTLAEDVTVDVAIVGGGIAGLTAATLLKEAGKTVAVLERDRIVRGVTGHTTAKLTSLHTLIYDHLIQTFGQEKAQAYGQASQAAIEQVAELVGRKHIDCDFARTSSYTYAESDEDVDKLVAEVAAAQRLGLPAVLVEQTPLPFPVKAAVRFDNQVRFHPRKYLLRLAQDIPGDGSFIFEQTRVLDVSEQRQVRVVADGGTVRAADVIVASHFPVYDTAFYFARLSPHRSYVLALRLDEPAPEGMFINSGTPTRSIRSHPGGEPDMILLTGEGHKTGQGGDTVGRYQRLEQWGREHFSVHSVEYRWSTQDNETIDRVPYIGKESPLSDHVYVATGFGGWGMSNGTVAGMLLRDLILGRDNPWAGVYDPNRFTLESAPQFVKENVNVAKHFVADRFTDKTPTTVAPGQGAVVESNAGKTALYLAEDGTEQRLSPVCTHLGCFVEWNQAEKSWDCPCHGSRYAVDGTVIHGPAIKGLKKK